MLTSKGELKSEDNCLDYNKYGLTLKECDGLKENQKWLHKVRMLMDSYVLFDILDFHHTNIQSSSNSIVECLPP